MPWFFLFSLIKVELCNSLEHINVKIPHKARRASVIQFSLSSLSHVVNTSLSLTFLLNPSVNIGENA